MEWEYRMDASAEKAPTAEYTTPHRVQAWFLGRSRDLWKQKYMDLKTEARRLERRVADVGESREKWRDRGRRVTSASSGIRSPDRGPARAGRGF